MVYHVIIIHFPRPLMQISVSSFPSIFINLNFICLCVYLSVCLSVGRSVCRSVFIYFRLFMSTFLSCSVFPYKFTVFSLRSFVFPYLSIYLIFALFLSVYLGYIYIYIYIYIYESLFLTILLCIHAHIYICLGMSD